MFLWSTGSLDVAQFFREPDRRQRFLLPVDMMDWLPGDDIVHLIVDAVGLMDLSAFESACITQPPEHRSRSNRFLHGRLASRPANDFT